MSQLPAMPLWVADFYSKTYHLTREERFAYLDVLMKTWVRNCRPFTDDPKEMALVLGVTVKRWLQLRPKLVPFFDLSAGTWRQENLEKQFTFVANRSEVLRRNGSLGGIAKANNANALAIAKANNLPKQNSSTHTHTQNKKEERDKSDLQSDFAAWYAAYPLKIARGKAEQAYRKARQEASAAELLEGIKNYRTGKPSYADWQGPAAWLNGKRWLDEYTISRTEGELWDDRPTGPPPPLQRPH